MRRRLTNRLWDIYAHTYDGLLCFWPYRHLLELMTREIGFAPGQHVADLGCGTGNLLQLGLAQPGLTAVGVDVSPAMLSVARRKLADQIKDGRLELARSEIGQYLAKQPAAVFDRIYLSNVVYALSNRDALWRDLLRTLKPGGRIILTTADRPGSWPIIMEHFEHSRLVTPRLLGVFVLDALINVLGRVRHFEFPDEATLQAEAERAGGQWHFVTRCYGGQVKGVNILASVTQ